jgi:RNA polymerase sigma factor (sigma-70 family)
MPRSNTSRLERRDPRNLGIVSTPALVEHFFRRDYGRVVAMLVRRAGVHHLQLVEDAVQHALMAALETWTRDGLPADPGGWIYKVGWHRAVQDLRKNARQRTILEAWPSDAFHDAEESPDPPLAEEIRDDMLRMLFVCCEEAIPRESQIVLALKILCGFSTQEIALRLFISEANVHKRLGRARERLRETPADLEQSPMEKLSSRLPTVHAVLYLLFNEGYLSAQAEQAIRRELCEEAVRLATLVAEHPVGAVPESFALLALMHLHSARLEARLGEAGDLLLLEEQDRSLWNQESIASGMEWLRRSAKGNVFSRFHAEAAIAAEHCLAPAYSETRWQEIAGLYAMLEQVAPSPLHALNRAVAVAEWQGPAAGLAILERVSAPASLTDSYLWQAVLGDLNQRAGHVDLAQLHGERASRAAPTPAIRDALRRRFELLERRANG